MAHQYSCRTAHLLVRMPRRRQTPKNLAWFEHGYAHQEVRGPA